MSDSWKVFLATAIGALVGGLVGETIIHYLWWIGMITGGLTGYFVYDWKRVVVAAGNAWRAAWTELPKRIQKIRDWRPHPNLGWELLAVVSIFFVMWCWFMIVVTGIFLYLISGTESVPGTTGHLTSLWLFCSGIVIVMMLATCANVVIDPDDSGKEKTQTQIEMAWMCFPPILTLLAIISLPGWIKTGVSTTARFIKTFTVRLFLEIHSEKRLICGVDAALGALIVHLAGGGILGLAAGTLLGGLIGLLNFKFITLRWLVPRGYVTLRD